jgi:hypothetical protein
LVINHGASPQPHDAVHWSAKLRGVAVASLHYLVVGWRADEQVRQLKASLLQALADERIGFVEDFLEDGGNVLHGHAAIKAYPEAAVDERSVCR